MEIMVCQETVASTVPLSSETISRSLVKWPSGVFFKGWNQPQKQWVEWVEQLLPSYGSLWKQLGIFDAISSSTYKICKDLELVLGLAEYWCADTNTFVFEWGEATITLEDVLNLGGYPVLGESINSPLPEELVDIKEKLIEERCKFYKTVGRKVTDSAWMKRFMGKNSNLEHIAFLSLWLSRYVFPTHPVDTVGKHVFSIAVHLSHGRPIALAPAILASIYRDLGLLKQGFSSSSESIIVWGPLQLLQMWACEHFPSLSSNSPNSLVPTEPRAARWHDLSSNSEISNVKSIISSLENFQWRPYSTSMNNLGQPQFLNAKEELANLDGEDQGLRSFAACLRACDLVGLECTIEKYLPQRVARQFGLNHDVPCQFSLSTDTNSIKDTLVKQRSCMYFKSEIQVSDEWKLKIKDLSVPPGFLPKNSTQKVEHISSDIAPRNIKDVLGKQDNFKCYKRRKMEVKDLSIPPEFLPKKSKEKMEDLSSDIAPPDTEDSLEKHESFKYYKRRKMDVKDLSVPPGFLPKKIKQKKEHIKIDITPPDRKVILENQESFKRYRRRKMELKDLSVPPGFL